MKKYIALNIISVALVIANFIVCCMIYEEDRNLHGGLNEE